MGHSRFLDALLYMPASALVYNKQNGATNTDKESSGGSNAFLEAEILEDSLSDEEIQLRAVAVRQMELNQHRATTLQLAIS